VGIAGRFVVSAKKSGIIMICKEEDMCCSCFLRRKRCDCGHEPFGWGPDMDGEYGVGCDGHIGNTDLTTSRITDALMDYHGIGDPIPWDLLFPILIWSGMNWIDHCEDEAYRSNYL